MKSLLPKKSKINQRALDKALATHIKASSFQVTVPSGENKEYAITFQTYMDPVVRHIILLRCVNTAIKKEEDGSWVIVPTILETTLHTAIFEFLSDAAFPMMVNEDGEEEPDLAKVGSYGSLFAAVFGDYADLFYGLETAVCAYLKEIIKTHNKVLQANSSDKLLETVYSSMFMQDFIKNPEMFEEVFSRMGKTFGSGEDKEEE